MSFYKKKSNLQIFDINTKLSPVLLGPSLVHSHKSFDSYYTLPSNMIRFKPSLSALQVFGSDGEVAIYNSMKTVFVNATHLLCTIHAKDDVTKKCKEIDINCTAILSALFGKMIGDIKIEGLIDTKSET